MYVLPRTRVQNEASGLIDPTKEGTFTITNIITSYCSIPPTVAPLQPVLQPPQPAAVEGVRTHLTCTAPAARPPATIAWFWEGSAVNGIVSTSTNDNGTSDVTSKLYVTPTKRQDGIEFVCEVRHNVLEVTGRPPYRITHILDVRCKYTCISPRRVPPYWFSVWWFGL